MKALTILFYQLLLMLTVNGGEPSITYDNTPLWGIPLEASTQEISGEARLEAKFHTMSKGAIETVRIRYFDQETWDTKAKAISYLAGFLSNQSHKAYNYQPWAQMVGVPEIECVIVFSEDRIASLREAATEPVRLHQEGRLLIWNTVACYRDETGRWFFVSVGDEFHRSHPKGRRELAKPPQK